MYIVLEENCHCLVQSQKVNGFYIEKKLLSLCLDYTKKICIDVNIENTGRCAFATNKGLKVTKAFTTATIFNPEVLAIMNIDEVNSHLQ